jgi:hypothetical protein
VLRLFIALAVILITCSVIQRVMGDDSESQWALVQAARERHSQSEFATRYRVLRAVIRTSDDGYEVRFGRTGGRGIIGVSYYFDGLGRFSHSVRWLCDGF